MLISSNNPNNLSNSPSTSSSSPSQPTSTQPDSPSPPPPPPADLCIDYSDLQSFSLQTADPADTLAYSQCVGSENKNKSKQNKTSSANNDGEIISRDQDSSEEKLEKLVLSLNPSFTNRLLPQQHPDTGQQGEGSEKDTSNRTDPAAQSSASSSHVIRLVGPSSRLQSLHVALERGHVAFVEHRREAEVMVSSNGSQSPSGLGVLTRSAALSMDLSAQRPLSELLPGEADQQDTTPGSQAQGQSTGLRSLGGAAARAFSALSTRVRDRAASSAAAANSSGVEEEPEDLEPTPGVAELELQVEGRSAVASVSQLRELVSQMPPQWQLSAWKRAYSISEDGVSFQTFFNRLEEAPACLLLLKDSEGACFGSFHTPAFHRQTPGLHYGDGDCFVFRWAQHPDEAASTAQDLEKEEKEEKERENTGTVDLNDDIPDQEITKVEAPGSLEVYLSTGVNMWHMLMSEEGIAVGGGDAFALELDQCFSRGKSFPSETYDNPILASAASFDCFLFEAWIPQNMC